MSHVHERDVTDHGDGKDVIDHETEGCHMFISVKCVSEHLKELLVDHLKTY